MTPSRRRILGSATAAAALWASVGAAYAEPLAVREDGVIGEFHAQPRSGRRPGVLMLNGSDGGIPSRGDAQDLVSAGHAVLALAYLKGFDGKPEGVPDSLNEVPLEAVFRGIDWLKRRSEVDPAKIAIVGLSRGAELALLVGSLRPDVRGVVAFSPSSRVWNGIPPVGSSPSPPRAAWTLAGAPVPFQASVPIPGRPMLEWFERAAPVEAARIPVERIRGPILLASSHADTIWPSTAYADEIAARIGGGRCTNLQFEDASHLLMGRGPPITKIKIPNTELTFDFGGSPDGTSRAKQTAWAATKQLLASL